MKIIINEHQLKSLIETLQNKRITEDEDPLKGFFRGQLDDLIYRLKNYKNNKPSESEDEIDRQTIITPGSYFVHPEYEKIKINYGSNAKPLNKDAEILLKSIVAETGYDSIRVGSTLRDYNLQAIVNKTNTESQMKEWYCTRGKEDCDELIQNWKQKDTSELAKYYEMRDKKYGKPMSNHILDFAIDVPYDTKMANTIEKIIKKGDSGIKRVYPEKGNALHIEFLFPVTGISGVKSPKISKDKKDIKSNVISKNNIIFDTKKPDSGEYALVYGGNPSQDYGAKFMFQQGNRILNQNVIYANNEIPIETIEYELKSINPKGKIRSVSGFSGGGSKTKQAMNERKYKFIGFIDPFLKEPINFFPPNTFMISRSENWVKYDKDYGTNVTKALSIMEDKGLSKKIPSGSYNHDLMPKIFFEEYGDLM